MSSPLIDQLKSTIDRLETKVAHLEAKIEGRDGVASPANGLRMILIGPPGAGMRDVLKETKAVIDCSLQEREPRHRGSRTNTAFAIWYVL